MKEYEVTEDRVILGVHRKIGDVVDMLPGQAKYYTNPIGSGLIEANEKGGVKRKKPKTQDVELAE